PLLKTAKLRSTASHLQCMLSVLDWTQMEDVTHRVTRLEVIEPGPRNPRRKLGRLDELAESLRAHGLLQPIVLRPTAGDRYEVVAGHRRLAAATQLGWTTIPAVVRSTAADEAYLLTLVENLQREDLSP